VTVIPLPCEDIVLRALLKRNWFHEETKRIKADAFIRDPKKDLDGLSVNIHSKTEAVYGSPASADHLVPTPFTQAAFAASITNSTSGRRKKMWKCTRNMRS
jgi:hypothetical protein